MGAWQHRLHPECAEEIVLGGAATFERLQACLTTLLHWLDERPHLRPWLLTTGAALATRRDVQRLSGSRTDASFRLRCGPYRIAFKTLPDRSAVLVTAIARWDLPSYRDLVRRHDERCGRPL